MSPLYQRAEAHPILKPLLDVMTSSLATAVNAPIERKIVELIAEIDEHPESADTAITNAGAQLADSLDIQATPRQQREFSQEHDGLARLDGQVERGA